MKRILGLTLSVATIAALAPIPALSGSYDADCEGVDCTVRLSTDGITTPIGSIPPSRITYWSVNGESSSTVGLGVATTILFGPIGLLGFLGKKQKYDFSVDGYDVNGKKVLLSFKFKKKEPATNLMKELHKISGLAMGNQRSIAEIKAIESGQSPLNAMAPALESDLQSSSMNNKLDCGRVLKDYECNYDAYLDANPSVKAWADANPELAAKEKTRLGAFTQEEIEQKAKLKENSLQRMQPALGAMKGYAPKPECNVKLHDYECSYDKYLEANPSMKTWAELNPEMANNERLKLQSVD